MTDSSGGIGISVSTLFFGVLGLVGFFFGAPKGPDRGVAQTMVVCTCVCLWLFYVITYMAQLNPLVAPQLHASSIYFKDDLPSYLQDSGGSE